jgi:hypothetical protein
MPIKHPGGFKFDFGSTVTILTSVAASTDYGKNINNLGVFTGVVLDETELNLKRDPKHISITLGGLDELQNAGKCDDKKEHDYKKPDYDQDHYDEKKTDYDKEHCDCKKPDCDLGYHDWKKPDYDKEHCDGKKSDYDKEHHDWKKPDYDKDHYAGKKPKDGKDHCDGKKHGHEVEVKKAAEFLVLSLTSPAYPFTAGQIVWINIEQIVAFSVASRN